MGQRLGYFGAVKLDDRVVLKTFLFLTMQGTPESKKLRQRWKLHRPDIEYNELDNLETFLKGEIQGDPQLVHVLEACGCGPLLALRNPASLSQAVRANAEMIKKYLRIDERPRLFRS
jgi:hypothetical protein